MSGLRPGDLVSLHYRLTCGNEEVVNTFAEQPEAFTLGSGELESRLESLLLGLEPGQHVTFDLAAGEAFGPYDDALVHALPRQDFPADMTLDIGHGVQFNLPNGQSLMGSVLTLDAAWVKVDFNHPLAGRPVTFEVEITAAEAAAVTHH